MKRIESFNIPQMTDHDAMSDIVTEDINENGSVQDGEDSVENMDFETFKNEAEYVSPEDIPQQTAEELKRVKQASKIGRALSGLQFILH